MTRTKKGKGRKSKKKNSTRLLFIVFTAVAVVTIFLLEYIDFKKGEKSVIFSKLIPLARTETKIDQFNTKLIRVLTKNKLHYDYFPDRENKYHFKVDIDQPRFDGLIEKIKTITAQLKGVLELTEIQGLADKSVFLYKVRLDKQVTHLLLINRFKPGVKEKKQPSPQPQKKVREEPVKKSRYSPRIAFIIDDMGAYDIGPLELKQLGIPVTASVLPDSRRAHEVVRWLREYKLMTMIHLPMQPTNSNGRHYDPAKVITVNSTDEEIRTLIRRAKQIIPTADGVNNHEGSLVTANSAVMRRVLEIIKEEGLFFVDSRTIGGTVAYDTARQLNVKTAHKDVFLDHVPTYSHSLAQIRKLVDIALQKGKAIAIGHPFETTLRAIKDSKRYIKAKGVTIVYVKELLE
jgi:polysaccharide deacetylase 2 family uncharacterized protein YibQ